MLYSSSDSDSSLDEEVLYLNRRRPKWYQEREDNFDKYEDIDFAQRFRLSKDCALRILNEIRHDLEYTSDRNLSISPMNQLLTTLRFYATGCDQLSAGDFSGCSRPTANRVIHRVSCSIASLRERYIKFPSTRQEIELNQRKFYDIASFPKVIGAIDCTHIKMTSPGGENAEIFRNRKGYFSLNVQAICDADLKFTDLVARWPGSTHDSTIFNNCVRRGLFERGNYGTSLLLGDQGYASKSYMLTPLQNPIIRAEHLFNESQIRTRNPIERLFGVWKRRFPVLALGFRIRLENMFPIITATAVLHNLLRDLGEALPQDDPELNIPLPWEALLGNGDIINEVVERGENLNFTVRRRLIENYFQGLL